MIDIEEVKKEIIDKLKPLNPEKIILFGSYAYGTPDANSDIDIYVVTKDEFIPQNFKEKSMIQLSVSRAMSDLLKKYPTDLITHTKAMHNKFIELDSMFSRKILKEGINLI